MKNSILFLRFSFIMLVNFFHFKIIGTVKLIEEKLPAFAKTDYQSSLDTLAKCSL